MTTAELRRALLSGLVIPAHPLALNEGRAIDERRQRALTRYYLAAGAGGVAVGVHGTQFAIHDNGMLEPVLDLAAEEVDGHAAATGRRVLKVAGVVGRTEQARRESALARDRGYDAVLLGLNALGDAPRAQLLDHCRRVAEIVPVVGFYLQPAVGGRTLSYDFWRGFLDIDDVVAIKVAPFDRYATLDVMRALAASGRQGEVALYTGNDDHILLDLLTRARFGDGAEPVGFAGGLLGQWAVWTRTAVAQFERVVRVRGEGRGVPDDLAVEAQQLTDANGAIFDVANGFRGCIPGIHEVLRRQGLLEGTWCLDPGEALSPGQREAIDRVWSAYPHLRDDAFVARRLQGWLD